ncbi:MAG: glycoside hydrolase family 3 N-terminal domain-containing protein [Phycisphaerae bacterium]
MGKYKLNNLRKLTCCGTLCLLVTTGAACTAQAREYIRVKLTPQQVNAQADALLKQMTLREKVRMMAFEGILDVPGVERLHIPTLVMSDASLGVRRFGASTAYPASAALASTWNRKLAFLEGRQIGSDCRARGVHVIFGPGVNIVREPQNGRNFEYLGEDPYLAGQMAAPWIRGVQSQGVAACAKHYVANEQETDRIDINEIISRRALEEIYLPPFRAAVRQGDVWTIMAAYDQVNGAYCTASRFLLTDVLRKRWGFKGVLMSDWGASHATLGPLKAGLDLEMHRPVFYNMLAIPPLLKSGQIAMSNINQHVRRSLRMMVAMNFLNRPQQKSGIPLNNPKSAAAAMKVAAEGTVLLRNKNHFLPLNTVAIKHIVVLGPMASPAVTTGGGSGYVIPIAKPVSMLAAVKKAAGKNAKVTYIPYIGHGKAYWSQNDFYAPDGTPGAEVTILDSGATSVPPMVHDVKSLNLSWEYPGALPRHVGPGFTAQWVTEIKPSKTGDYLLKFFCNNGDVEAFLNKKKIIEQWRPRPVIPFMDDYHFVKGHTYQLVIKLQPTVKHGVMPAGEMRIGLHRIHYPLLTLYQRKEIKSADAVITCVGYGPRLEHEDFDRSYHLPSAQGRYIAEVAKLNPHQVVVVNAGGGIAMSHWIHKIAGLVYAWYPGENGNTAVADIIFGKIDPSGRLPDTFARNWRTQPAYGHYPGHDIYGLNPEVHFAEGIYVGYRWYDKKHITPRYPFGFGLSYTSFSIGGLHITTSGSGKARTVTVTANVTNTGHRSGAEVVQLYIRPQEDRAHRCVQTLKGFGRVNLKPGQSKTVTMKLDWRDFAYFNTKANHWEVPAGKYQIAVGYNSRDMAAAGMVEMK